MDPNDLNYEYNPDYLSVKDKLAEKDSLRSKKKSSSKDTISLRVENIVISINLGLRLDLEDIVKKDPKIKKRKNFPGLILKYAFPKVTFLIFKSGKIIGTGIQTEKVIPTINKRLFEQIKSTGVDIPKKVAFKIENLVLNCDFHQRIDLDLASISIDQVMYDPEIFPGLILREYNPKITFLIFSTGKSVITGSKNLEFVKKKIQQIRKKLKPYFLKAITV
jgi:transcription initiation factor TFIID TATA-box-binding protein